MLVELRIRDLAVIRDLRVPLASGLNVLTGETGAGKSILVGALSLLLGERASSGVVRVGADRALVEGVFDLATTPELQALLVEHGFPEEEGMLFLRREIQREGRNRAWINGSPATAGAVGLFGRALVDLHGQHDHQTLLHPEAQRDILDTLAGSEQRARAVRECHARAQKLRQEIAVLDERKRTLGARADFIRFQLDEIRGLRPEAGEDETLEVARRKADHAEELARESGRLHAMLDAAERSVADLLADALERIRKLSRLDPALAGFADPVAEAYHLTREVGRSLGDYEAGIDLDPQEANRIRERFEGLQRLKRKYGGTLESVLSTETALEAELAELDGAEIQRGTLDAELREAELELNRQAAALTERRLAGAERLSREVGHVLPELGMAGATFQVRLEPLAEVGRHGAERVRFLASLNPGFAVDDLARIASGGELSRVMLALKSVLAREDRVPTLIFDEVDAGVGGAVGLAVARKLAQVAMHHQVLVITHLSQVAARGHHHLRVEKREEEGIASTGLLTLTAEARVDEIARMLGGDPNSATSRAHARELLGVAPSAPSAPA